MNQTTHGQPATQSPVDVATVRFIAKTLLAATGGSDVDVDLAAALAAVPPDVAPGPAFWAQKAEQQRQERFTEGERAALLQAVNALRHRGRVMAREVVLRMLGEPTPSLFVTAPEVDYTEYEEFDYSAKPEPVGDADQPGRIDQVRMSAVDTVSPVREWGVRHGDDCRLNHGQMRPGTYATREAAEEGAQYIKGRGLCIPVVVSRTPGGVWEPVEGSDFGAVVAEVSRRAAEAKFGQPVEQEEATDERSELANVIWETSRADEGTISATGANIIADKLLACGYSKAELEKTKRGAKTLGQIIDKQLRDVLDITGMHHLIGADGDGDWGAVWDHLWSMKAAAQPDRFSVAEIEAALHPIAFRFGREYNADSPSGLSQDIAAHLLTALRAGREGEQR